MNRGREGVKLWLGARVQQIGGFKRGWLSKRWEGWTGWRYCVPELQTQLQWGPRHRRGSRGRRWIQMIEQLEWRASVWRTGPLYEAVGLDCKHQRPLAPVGRLLKITAGTRTRRRVVKESGSLVIPRLPAAAGQVCAQLLCRSRQEPVYRIGLAPFLWLTPV